MTRYTWHDEPVVKPIRVYVPSGETVTQAPAGYTVRLRGDREGTVVHSYRCPVHGLFDAHVSRADVPDAVVCPVRYEPRMFDLFGADAAKEEYIRALCVCGLASPWAGSLCGIGFAAGEVKG